MQAPSSELRSQPWSPVGYRVVQVGEESLPPLACPQTEPLMSSPVEEPLGCYRVVEVADEKVPPRPAALWPRKVRPKRAADKPPMVKLWGPIVAAVVAILLPMFVFGWILASSTSPEQPAEPMFAAALPGQVVIPDQLVQWKADAAVPAIKEERHIGLEAIDAPVAAAPVPKEPIADRETFGTEVEFARNSVEAARMARGERKLVFLLHVSGNFEESQFT
jgi:hypothetical protein